MLDLAAGICLRLLHCVISRGQVRGSRSGLYAASSSVWSWLCAPYHHGGRSGLLTAVVGDPQFLPVESQNSGQGGMNLHGKNSFVVPGSAFRELAEIQEEQKNLK